MKSGARAFGGAMLAYLVPSFVIAIFWHLKIFAPYYDDLEIYRDDVLVPLGLLSMIIQAAFFAWIFPRLAGDRGTLVEGLRFAVLAGVVAWSYTVLPVAAKFPMTSVAGFVGIETAFNAVQCLVAGPLIALAYARFGSG